MRFLIYIILSLLVMSSFKSQTIDHKRKAPTKTIEIMAVPSFFYNHLSIGFSKRNRKREHTIDLSSNASFLYSWAWNTNLNYNFNFITTNSKGYIPIWFKISNTRRTVEFEDGYFPHTLKFKIGTGYGKLFKLNDKWGLRTELGLGASINLTDTKGAIFEYQINYTDYSFDTQYPKYHPPLSLAVKCILRFAKLKKSKAKF